MRERSGRLERRISLSVPIQVSSQLDPAASERTVTENVSSLGVRALLLNARDMNESVMITSLMGNERSTARVVYCQRLPNGRFAVGLEFKGSVPKWLKGFFLRGPEYGGSD